MSSSSPSNSAEKTANSVAVKSNSGNNLKTSSFLWTVNNYMTREARNETTKSPVFHAVDDDFNWHMEFSTSISNVRSASFTTTPVSPSGRVLVVQQALLPGIRSAIPGLNKQHSLIVRPDSNDQLAKCGPISGGVQFSVMHNNNKVWTKKKHFFIVSSTNQSDSETQTSTAVGFSDFVGATAAKGWISQDTLKILCEINFMKGKNINSLEFPDSNLGDDFERLLTDEHYSDVIISVNGKDYPVYKGILASRSSVFDAMFKSNMQESMRNRVEISDIDQEVFGEMLLYIYTGKIRNLQLVFELLPCADKYDLKGMKTMCEEVLSQQLSKGNVIKTLILAHTYHAEKLKARALQFVKLHAPYENLKNTEIWNVLTTFHPELMKDMLTLFLEK